VVLGLDDLEMATVEYIDWYNNRRLHGELSRVLSRTLEAPANHLELAHMIEF